MCCGTNANESTSKHASKPVRVNILQKDRGKPDEHDKKEGQEEKDERTINNYIIQRTLGNFKIYSNSFQEAHQH